MKEGEIANHLNLRFQKSDAQIESYETNSYIYGDTVEDIVSICMTAETAESNDKPFDPEKLEIFYEFVEKFPNEIGLTTETRDVPQKGMVRANQPQIVSVISRVEK